MDAAPYVRGVFEKHRRFIGGALPSGFTMVELGPGDSVGSALFACGAGAARSYLVDVGSFAVRDVSIYRAMSRHGREAGYAIPNLARARTLDDVLAECSATYLTGGLRSFADIPTGSVDFLWSNSAVQHVRRDEIPLLCSEMRRVLKAEGVASHTIDFTDMLGGALNHLRVPSWLWESGAFARSGIYTNRARCSEMLEAFQRAGFATEVVTVKRWPSLPTRRGSMAQPFRSMPEDDLLVFHLDVVLRPRAPGRERSPPS